MKTNLFIINLMSFILLSINSIDAQSVMQIGTTNTTVDTVYTGLSTPWEIIYAPDNKIWVTEKSGIVSRIDPITKIKDTVFNLSSVVYAQSEAGLLGMKLHPNFPTTKEVFLVYTYKSGNIVKERLVKYTYNDTTLISPQILIDNIEAGSTNVGSRIDFLPDTTILMTIGDNMVSGNAQTMSSLNGKILRLTTIGGIPSDNPIAGSFVYSYGHRNPQGLLVAPNGKIYETEVGASSDDEFQIIEQNRNYGWPYVEGFCDSAADTLYCSNYNLHEPLLDWTPTISPGDLAYYNNSAFPEWHNCILMTSLSGKQLVAIKLDAAGTGTVAQTAYLTNLYGRLRDICISPSKEIYIATNGADTSSVTGHSILRISFPTPLLSKQNGLDAKPLVYPTVAKEFVNVEMQNPQSIKVDYTLTDITGMIVKRDSFSGNKFQASVVNLSQGIYFLTLQQGQQQLLVKKIIKE